MQAFEVGCFAAHDGAPGVGQFELHAQTGSKPRILSFPDAQDAVFIADQHVVPMCRFPQSGLNPDIGEARPKRPPDDRAIAALSHLHAYRRPTDRLGYRLGWRGNDRLCNA